jgi:hypothetical protein
MKKSFLILIVLSLLVLQPSNVSALIEDEQWPIPNEFAQGHHSLLIEEQLSFFRTFSQLSTWTDDGNFLCKSVEDEYCSQGKILTFNALLPVCTDGSQVNCIEGLRGTTGKGEVKSATFDQYTYRNHPGMYVGNQSKGVPLASSPSIWKMPGLPHPGGDEYAIVVGLDGVYDKSNINNREQNFYLNLFPVVRKTGIFAPIDGNGFDNVNKCIQRTAADGKAYLGCGGGAQDFGNFRCAVKTDQNGDCYLQKPFPSNSSFEVIIRLASEPIGWMHGRLLNPIIDISNNSQGGVTLKVEAGSVKVPILYYGNQYSVMPAEIKNYWDTCLSARTCISGTRIPDSSPEKEPNGNLRNVQHNPLSYGDRVIELVKTFSGAASDKSVAVPSAWNIRSLTSAEMSKANGCFSTGIGTKGIVTTNSTAYSEGPPSFTDGTLNYKVASTHFNPDGTEFKGTYNLVMRSEVARCLYKFSKAPLSATIQVVSDNGQTSVATTIFGEKNGWVELAAYNFGFSAPTISVKLTQEPEVVVAPTQTPTPTPSASTKTVAKKVTITCIKGKTSKKVTAVKPKCPAGYKKK